MEKTQGTGCCAEAGHGTAVQRRGESQAASLHAQRAAVVNRVAIADHDVDHRDDAPLHDDCAAVARILMVVPAERVAAGVGALDDKAVERHLPVGVPRDAQERVNVFAIDHHRARNLEEREIAR